MSTTQPPAGRATKSGEGAARVAQSALLREVPAAVAAGRLATRCVWAAAETRVGGDLLEIVSDGGRPRWLIGHTRGKGLPAVRLASVAMTSFRDACAQPGLSLPEIARVVDRSVTRAAEDEDFVTAVFAEFDPRGWLQLVTCGHPPPLRLTGDGDLQALTPAAYATPLGLHPDIRPSTFSVDAGDRLVFYTDGLLEARDRAGRYFRLEDCLDTLRRTDLQAAADELLDRLLAHTGRRLDDDVAMLLFEAASPSARPEDEPAAAPAPAGDTLPDGDPPAAAASGFLGRLKQAAAVAKNVAVRAEAASNTVSRKVTEEDAWDELHGGAELLTEIARARRRAPSTESQMTSGCLGYQGKEACDAC